MLAVAAVCSCEASICSCNRNCSCVCLKPSFACVLAVMSGLKSPFVLAVAVVDDLCAAVAIVLAVVPSHNSSFAVVIAVVSGWNPQLAVALAIVGSMWDAVALEVAVVRWNYTAVAVVQHKKIRSWYWEERTTLSTNLLRGTKKAVSTDFHSHYLHQFCICFNEVAEQRNYMLLKMELIILPQNPKCGKLWNCENLFI